jgi:murein DD-endopeptidase MepM/ murein hydrolase activator NlpD
MASLPTVQALQAKRQAFALLVNAGFNTASLLPDSLIGGGVAALDLSVSNLELAARNIENTQDLDQFIASALAKRGVQVGVGGYGEQRLWYQRSKVFSSGALVRDVHLGIDIWAKAGTEICAPLAGRLHSFQNNAAFGDYGPTIILQHDFPDLSFYTLYGHLSLESLAGLEVGREFAPGSQLAEIGAAPLNGDWPPHLHFQVILDLLGKSGDFPGVAAQAERSFYLELCPDPASLLAPEIAAKCRI